MRMFWMWVGGIVMIGLFAINFMGGEQAENSAEAEYPESYTSETTNNETVAASDNKAPVDTDAQATPEQPATTAADSTTSQLTISVNGIRNSKGVVHFAVFSDQAAFVQFDAEKADAYTSVAANQGTTETVVEVPNNQDYAVFMFHDEDSNDDFAMAMNGTPEEGYGYSNNVGAYASPAFKEAAFKVDSNQARHAIKVIYY